MNFKPENDRITDNKSFDIFRDSSNIKLINSNNKAMSRGNL